MDSYYCFDSSPNSTSPHFPALYIPRALEQGGIYLCSIYDTWRFTLLWTLIIYAVLFLTVAAYAFLIQAGIPSTQATRKDASDTTKAMRSDLAQEKRAANVPADDSGLMLRDLQRGPEAVGGLIMGARRNWKVVLAVGAGYVVVGGAEAVLAGSVVGAILGTVYEAGGYKLSTWVPLVWAVINAVFLILRSFSIQERLL